MTVEPTAGLSATLPVEQSSQDLAPNSEAANEIQLAPAEQADQGAVGMLVDRMEKVSTGFDPQLSTEAQGGVAIVGEATAGEGSQAFAEVGIPQTEIPSYRELMQNFRAATDHAVEVTLVGSAGTSMAGSMSKLMSGQ
ncbi:hypothetical protein [Roseobacter weihaiensis]|uniref:hypothetical protein n=1 Tax=Roseobacter weihaiensis TaxID=2763262 RepID=UPI001D0AC647|nr:hypothetical protein [Roseobacter sp. H9]